MSDMLLKYDLKFIFSPSVLTAILQVNLGWSLFIEAKDDESGGDSYY